MDPIRRAAEMLRGVHRVVVVTGAGVSAESGVPTFREGQSGIWDRHDVRRLATPEAFRRHPGLVSRWYDERRRDVLLCQPNPAHRALATWEHRLRSAGGQFTVLTQNVDRLHQRAGNGDVVELHGSLHTWRCTVTGRERRDLPLPLPQYPMPSEAGGLYRPGVVWFGEDLPEPAMRRSFQTLAACDAVLSIGTSALVYPAAGFVELAQSRSVVAIEINLEPTPVSELVDISMLGRAGELVPRLVEAIYGAG
ncbi:MAG: NAD-dependent deacylase [Phycisphaerales bacterium]|nr:NAD-dependent deacylase [Phycisphaerales bacterium]